VADIVFIVNPTWGGGRTRRRRREQEPAFREALGGPFEVHLTERTGSRFRVGPQLRDSPGQIRTAVARSPFDRFGSIQSLESLARDRIAVTIGR